MTPIQLQQRQAAWHRPFARRDGFTLVEVLVVMAIIAVLIALLLPALSSVRYEARLTVCMSNQRQIAAAMNAYAINNDGYFPREDAPLGAGDNSNTVTNAYWSLMTQGYGVPPRMMFYPFQPVESINDYRMFWFPMFGYGLWVPRSDTSNTGLFPPNAQNHGNKTVYDPSGNAAGPVGLQDLITAARAPILTDVATSVAPAPASGRIDVNNVTGWYGLPGGFYHFTPAGKIGPINETFADNHVERRTPDQFRIRYTQGPFVDWR